MAENETVIQLGTRQIILAVLVVIMILAVFFFIGFIAGKPNSPEEASNDTYNAQIASLENAKKALQSLAVYIDDQRKKLQLSQSSLTALREEENKIHPLLEADRKIIDAMFAVREQRSQAAQSRERWFGFGLGVIASLLATGISRGIVLFLQRRRPKGLART